MRQLRTEGTDHERQFPDDRDSRKLRLPRDASIQYNDYPPQLYLNMTITKVEHIAALSETLETFSRLLDQDE